MSRHLSDTDRLRRAIESTGMSDRAFAANVLDVDERTVRYWLAEDRGVPGPVRVVCQAILDHPVVARALERACAKLNPS
jgi:hypothetical protein